MEASLNKISENFTNDPAICVPLVKDLLSEEPFRAGSKCALLKNLEVAEHKHTPVSNG